MFATFCFIIGVLCCSFIVLGCQLALRVPSAETRLTVYRRLHIRSCVLSNETHNKELCAFKRNEVCHYVAIFALDLNNDVCNTLMQFGNSVALNSVYIR